eukprot:Protomagalhaensia_wolfi_Nauph_80__827@NODE_1479_length_1509_cov_138_708163_g1145_i0_p2_GENE_NODE_1479_length_1509_cov_138_708163_g1145_i0NODE_1479_length_1509_cov_138_708163_g1145_i0_p2_ORF_typecomplete_len212_score42_67Acetyltransf_1/PF00583_25/4_2e15Acetyltransf_10/PF13673_7/1_2e14Acetyltransf_7/PF13508_7/6_6e12Acetyltransf_4/PF13420_7/1_8e06Acetyltransf_9/PF13527_7/0_0003FR47/PF08445_10/0_00016NodA/PF02474_15/0_0017Acetyltransf_3/PF13302_7/0_013Acetyltransf_8/PF13523_6/4_7e03Acetyltransf_8/PF
METFVCNNFIDAKKHLDDRVWIIDHDEKAVVEGALLPSLVSAVRCNMRNIYIQDRWDNDNGVVGWSDDQKATELSTSEMQYIFFLLPAKQAFEDLQNKELEGLENLANSAHKFLIGFVGWLPDDQAVAFISEFGIDRFYQGQGIGRRLMECFEEQVISQKFQYCRLIVQNSNQGAFDFYKAMGFRHTQKGPNYKVMQKSFRPKKQPKKKKV